MVDITVSDSANCSAQDSTKCLTVSNEPFKQDQESDESVTLPVFAQEHFFSACSDPFCSVCKSAITYIAGYFVRSISKSLPCKECETVLHHSVADPCDNKSLIVAKSYNPKLAEEYNKVGLVIPSGSVVKLLLMAERYLRNRRFQLSDPRIHQKIVHECLMAFEGCKLFAIEHDTMHIVSLAHKLLSRFITLRIRKALQDKKREPGKGNHIHRMRIVQNL